MHQRPVTCLDILQQKGFSCSCRCFINLYRILTFLSKTFFPSGFLIASATSSEYDFHQYSFPLVLLFIPCKVFKKTTFFFRLFFFFILFVFHFIVVSRTNFSSTSSSLIFDFFVGIVKDRSALNVSLHLTHLRFYRGQLTGKKFLCFIQVLRL